MSWFRKALSVCLPESGSYYTVIDPAEFYEWKFTQHAPKGALFSRHLPPSDIFTEGKIIASASLSDQYFKQVDKGFRLQSSIPVDLVLTAGVIQTPQELLDKYNNTLKTFNSGVNSFKEDALIRLYLISKSDVPNLHLVADHTDTNLTLHNYGPIKDVLKKIGDTESLFQKSIVERKGRAFELEEWKRFQNAMDFVNNSHLHVDASKMERLLMSAKIEPVGKIKTSWHDYYLESSESAQVLYSQIEKFSQNKWVRASKSRGK